MERGKECYPIPPRLPPRMFMWLQALSSILWGMLRPTTGTHSSGWGWLNVEPTKLTCEERLKVYM